MMITSCGTIPQPFRHQGRADPLARPQMEQTEPDEPQPVTKRLTARLGTFAGLPGDGNQALLRALKGALERRGLLVVGEGGDVVVTPILRLEAATADGVPMSFTWAVTTIDGLALGQAQQKGSAPLSQINGNWGRLARDIAEGGADGIVQVVQSAFTKGRAD